MPKPVLLSTAYFPPAGWFSLLLSFPVFIEKHENFQRQTFRNRCHICTERGILPLTLPVIKTEGNHTPITKVQIFNQEKWYKKHWRAIQSAYEASPYFLYYQDEIKPFFEGKYDNLFQFNTAIILKLCELMNIRSHLHFTDTFEKNPPEKMDMRTSFSPKKPLIGHYPEYTQVFSDRYDFFPGVSILDVLFNLGSESKSYLSKISIL